MLAELIKALFGRELTDDEVKAGIAGSLSLSDMPPVKALLAGRDERLDELTAKLAESKTALDAAKASVQALEPEAEAGRAALKAKRDEAKRLYRALKGEKATDAMLAMLDELTGDRLEAIRAEYAADLEARHPLKCGKCGSAEVSRAEAKADLTGDQPDVTNDYPIQFG